MSKTYYNTCSLDCPSSCLLLTEVKDGRVVGIKGDPRDPYSHGKPCARGYAWRERIYSKERILYPLKQKGRGSGNWQRISWEQAYDEIIHKLIEVYDEYGNFLPVCLSKYLGTQGLLSQSVTAFFNSLGPVTTLLGDPCLSTGADGMTLNYGACKKPIPEDMLNSRLIIIWGTNLAWSAPHQMRYIFEAQEKGAIVVVIDPLFTATVARSDLFYQIRPGTDGKLALALAKVLVENNWVDWSFIEDFSFGWSRYYEHLKKVDINEISLETGISTKDIWELARLYGNTKSATIRLGFGIQRGLSGGQQVRAIDNLATLTGNIGKAGGNVHYHHRGFEALLLPQSVHQEELEHRGLGMNWYSTADELDPPIEFFWVAGRNPVSQDPDSVLMSKVLQNIKTVIVVDYTLTATGQIADYFLPVASPFEFEDLVLSWWHYGIGLNQQAITPLGESKSDFEIVNDLAIRLEKLRPGLSSFPLGKDHRSWLKDEYGERLYKLTGINDFQELVHKTARLQWPEVPWMDYNFKTPSGRYEFYSNKALSYGIDPLPAPKQQFSRGGAYPFRLMVIRHPLTLNSQFYDITTLRKLDTAPVLLVHPDTGAQKNLAEGDIAVVYNENGEIQLPIKCTLSIPSDIVVAYMGMEDLEEKPVNTLLSFYYTDMGQVISGSPGVAFDNCFVNLTGRG